MQGQARHRLRVYVGVWTYRAQSSLHDIWSGGAGGLGPDASFRSAGGAARGMGLVVYGRHRRHVWRDVRADRAVLPEHDRTGTAYRSGADDFEHSAEWAGAAGFYGQWARVA